MGNACTINSSAVLASQRSSPFLSLTFPAQPEFPEDNTYQNKSGSLYQLNQANIQNSLLAYTTINNTKPSRRHVYTLNRRNLQKAIDSQEIDISLTDSAGNEETNTVLLPLPGLDKGEGDDYGRLQQKTWLFGKEGNNKEIMNIPSLFTDNNQEEVQISYKNTNYRKEQMEREEREKKIAEGLSRIFGGSHHIDFIRSSSLTRENKVPELTDKKDVFSKEGISLSDCSPFAGSAIPSVTNVEGDECSSGQTTTRRVKKALIESLMAKNESTLKKTDHSKSKSLINYCNEEIHEQNIMAELYEGVGAPQVKVEKKEETKPESEKIEEKKLLLPEKKCDVNVETVASEKKDSVEKKYTSNRAPLSARKGAENVLCVTGSPTSEFLLSNRELRREKQLRNESFAERLMESMLEDRPDEKEGRLATIGASGEKCPLPLLRRNLFDSERKSYRGNVYESNGKDKQEPYVRGFESINYTVKEETKVVENKEGEQKFQTPTKKVDSLNKENRQSVSPKMNSAAKGFVSVTELLDAGDAVGVKEEPVVVPVVMKEESSVKLVMRMEPVEEVLNEKKTILQEVEDLQKEVFEKMSHVTSSLKTTGTLNPDKILELKEIQDKLQMLTRLVNTGGDTTRKSSGSTHNNTPINQLRVENFNAEHTREIGVVDNNFCSPIPADGSFTIKPYDIKPIPIPKIFDVDLSEIMKKKKPCHAQSRLATEADSSIMKPSQYPVESRTTLEFFDTEMDCPQNPKEMWTKQVDLKSVKTLSELDQSGVSHRAATGHHKERRTSSHKRHSENSSQLYKQVAVEANPVNFQHMIRKLSYPKNLSTYNQPQLSQRESHSKGRASVGNYPVKNVKGSVTERSQSPISARTTVKQDPLSRRQSGTVTKKPLERRSSNSQNAMCSRKPSMEKMKTCNVEMKPSVSPTMTRDMSREKIVQGRMSVGSHDVNKGGLTKGVNSRKGTMERSVGSGKGRKSSTVTQYRRESTEPCQEGDLFEVNYDTNKAGMLYEEITRLNQKLAENRSHLKTMTTMTEPNEPDSGTLSQRNRISKMLQDRGNKEGAYSARARKRMEYSNPATARAGYQNTEQSLVSERRHTGNYEFQPEQNGGYIATEPSSHVESKREQAIRMRTKMIEEIARRQSLMEDSEWALNRNIPTIQVVKALSRNGIKNLM